MNKKIYISLIVILIIIIIGGLIILFTRDNETTNAHLNATENIQSNIENNQNENKNLENQNEIQTNTQENTTMQNTQGNASNSSETFEETPKTEEEKAIAIVKQDYGENQNVKFTLEGMDANSRYIIAVRNKNTTEALAFYTVNVSDNTFTKREMN